MQHLNSETLARLVDEAPCHEEALHLGGCEQCRHELEELRTQTAALAGLPALQPPTGQWRFLESRLRAEGLIRPGRAARPWWSHAPLRVAAALALFLLGGVAGAGVARGAAGAGSPVGFAEGLGPAASGSAATAEEAVHLLRERETAYLAALERYTELSGAGAAADPAARLAALEGIVLTTRAALEEAPADPVINGYHLTALGQRDVVLRQLAQRLDDPWF